MEQWKPLITCFLAKNSQINLSAIRDEEGVFVKHIQDSLEIEKVLSFPDGSKIVDVGTGSGFPLMPLAKEFPKCHFMGIDSVRKKTVAVNEILKEMNILNATVERMRMEQYQGEKFDFVTARAVAYADILIPRIVPLIKPWGTLILWKQKSQEEQAVLEKMMKKYHLCMKKTHEYQLFEGDIERVLYLLEKK